MLPSIPTLTMLRTSDSSASLLLYLRGSQYYWKSAIIHLISDVNEQEILSRARGVRRSMELLPKPEMINLETGLVTLSSIREESKPSLETGLI